MRPPFQISNHPTIPSVKRYAQIYGHDLDESQWFIKIKIIVSHTAINKAGVEASISDTIGNKDGSMMLTNGRMVDSKGVVVKPDTSGIFPAGVTPQFDFWIAYVSNNLVDLFKLIENNVIRADLTEGAFDNLYFSGR